jgi:hypothetical protein
LAQELLRQNPNDASLLNTVIDLHTMNHWSAWPLIPIHRFGNKAAIGIWVLFIVLVNVNKHLDLAWFGYFVWFYLAWCLYSWLHGPIFSRIVKWRGL